MRPKAGKLFAGALLALALALGAVLPVGASTTHHTGPTPASEYLAAAAKVNLASDAFSATASANPTIASLQKAAPVLAAAYFKWNKEMSHIHFKAKDIADVHSLEAYGTTFALSTDGPVPDQLNDRLLGDAVQGVG